MESWYRDASAPLGAELRAFPMHSKRAFADFMAQAYYWVANSTRLICLAAGRIDPSLEVVHRRMIDHAAEERGHHLVAQKDVEKLGFSLADFSELPSTAALYQTQYYQIEHVHPLAFFGYIVMLEGLSVLYGHEGLAIAEKAHGVDATRFLKMHANADEDHLPKAFAAVASFPPFLQDAARVNCARSIEYFRMMLREIVARSGER
jgi:Iron-containing redox enzyme